jgi:hypothetical protein
LVVEVKMTLALTAYNPNDLLRARAGARPAAGGGWSGCALRGQR